MIGTFKQNPEAVIETSKYSRKKPTPIKSDPFDYVDTEQYPNA